MKQQLLEKRITRCFNYSLARWEPHDQSAYIDRFKVGDTWTKDGRRIYKISKIDDRGVWGIQIAEA